MYKNEKYILLHPKNKKAPENKFWGFKDLNNLKLFFFSKLF